MPCHNIKPGSLISIVSAETLTTKGRQRSASEDEKKRKAKGLRPGANLESRCLVPSEDILTRVGAHLIEFLKLLASQGDIPKLWTLADDGQEMSTSSMWFNTGGKPRKETENE